MGEVHRLELRGISKSYPGVIANEDISFAVPPGAIHAVLGENGAGKSTLMKVIYGATRADHGEIYCDGELLRAHSPARSRALGISMVYQHFALFESVSVIENIALSSADKSFDLEALATRVREIAQKYGLPLEPERLVHSLSVGERQRVEIVRCLLQQPRLLILDEPTSMLTPQAAQQLFVTLRLLAQEGLSILYISHKLDEVKQLCDSATILRHGRVIGSVDPKTSSTKEIAQMMVGGKLEAVQRRQHQRGASPVLEVQQLDLPSADLFGVDLRAINLKVYGGEVVGLAGVAGNGQKELIDALSGELPLSSKPETIKINSQPAGALSVEQRRRLGMTYVPEERLGRGSVPEHDLGENSALTAHGSGMVRWGILQRTKARGFARGVVDKFSVKAGSLRNPARSLSGGNLQKFIVGREIELQPKLLLIAQPTWGVDVGAAAFIRQRIMDLSSEGTAVLVVSEDLDELLEICDQIYVISQGTVSEPLSGAEMSTERIGVLMTA